MFLIPTSSYFIVRWQQHVGTLPYKKDFFVRKCTHMSIYKPPQAASSEVAARSSGPTCVKVTRRPHFPGTVPVSGGLSLSGAVPGFWNGKGSSLLMNIHFQRVGHYSCLPAWLWCHLAMWGSIWVAYFGLFLAGLPKLKTLHSKPLGMYCPIIYYSTTCIIIRIGKMELCPFFSVQK